MAEKPRPSIGIFFERESIPLIELVGSLGTEWAVVWILDGQQQVGLERFGHVADITGLDARAAAAVLAPHGLDGVVAFADCQLVRAAHIAGLLGLPHNPAHVAEALVDKARQRDLMHAAGIIDPAYCEVGETIPPQLASLKGPLVIKPAVGFGGRDTVCVTDTDAAIAEINRRRRDGNYDRVLVEQCLGVPPPNPCDTLGDYVSVELLVNDATVACAGVTGRMPLAPPFRETGGFIPDALENAVRDDVVSAATAAAQAIGVRNGCLHVEVKLTDAGPRIIEVNGRVAGGGIPQVLRRQGGPDLYQCAAAIACGRMPDLPQVAANGRIRFDLAVQPPLEEDVELAPDWRHTIGEMPYIEDVRLRATNARVEPCDGSYGFLLQASGSVASHTELSEVQRQLQALVVAREVRD